MQNHPVLTRSLARSVHAHGRLPQPSAWHPAHPTHAPSTWGGCRAGWVTGAAHTALPYARARTPSRRARALQARAPQSLSASSAAAARRCWICFSSESSSPADNLPRSIAALPAALRCLPDFLDNIVCTTGQLKLPFLLSTFSIDLSTVETARGVTFLQVFASPAQNSAARNLRRRISQTPFKRESWLHLAGAEMCWLQLFGLRTKTDTRSIDRAWCCGASHWRGCS